MASEALKVFRSLMQMRSQLLPERARFGRTGLSARRERAYCGYDWRDLAINLQFREHTKRREVKRIFLTNAALSSATAADISVAFSDLTTDGTSNSFVNFANPVIQISEPI